MSASRFTIADNRAEPADSRAKPVMGIFLGVALACAAMASPGYAKPKPGDPEAGKALFGACSTCHQVGRGAKDRSGPSLNGLIGTRVGARGEFPSSLPMVFLGLNGMTWTDETLDEYLLAPSLFVRGVLDPSIGFISPKKRADLIAYIIQAGAVESGQ